MKTDGLFTTYLYEIPFSQYGKPIYLGATGDWHYNTEQCDKEKFREFIKEIKKRNGYLIGTGDYLDSISSSERRALKCVDIHDQTMVAIEQLFEKHTEDLAKELKGVNVIGLGGGNHYYQFASGITTDQILAHKLGCKYLGVNSIVRLVFRYDKSHTHKIDIAIHHGKGGGSKRVGTSLNHLQDMASCFDCDIYLQGHNHDRCIDYINRLGLTSNHKLQNRKLLLARTGSFMKSYQEGISSYAVDALYPPGDLGGVIIKLTPVRKETGSCGVREDTRFVDIEATI